MLQFLDRWQTTAIRVILNWRMGKTYFASDNFFSENCKGLDLHDLIDIAICNDIHFNSTKEEGVVSHHRRPPNTENSGWSALAGTIGKGPAYYHRTVDLLEHLE